tara:strand:+ start:117 stop:353 length:237 start_codon:yes stop_codon:yes gene_type:complete
MTNIFKIILKTFRIIYLIIRVPFGFILIITPLLELAGIIGPFSPGGDILPLIVSILFGASIIYSAMKKKDENNRLTNN